MFKPEEMLRTISAVPKERVRSIISTLYNRKICQIKKSENDMDILKFPEEEINRMHDRLEFVRQHLVV